MFFQNLIPLEKLDITNVEDAIDGKSNVNVLNTCDLFSAHDFDIQLELDAKLPRKSISVSNHE